MIVRTRFTSDSGLGTAMFSRAGKTTIDQYMCFSDNSKTNEIVVNKSRSSSAVEMLLA
jgi:hypothetical protein